MRINSIQYNPRLTFKSYFRTTEQTLGNNRTNQCIHESHLMRDLDSSVFATDYILRHFPQGANITVEGCSQMEAYTWAALFHDANPDKRFKITGYDIVSEVIEDAKLGVLDIDSLQQNEFFLDPELKLPLGFLSAEQQRARNLFNKCFERIPEKWKTFCVKPLDLIDKPKEEITLKIKRIEYLKQRYMDSYILGKYFIPRHGVFDGVLDFSVGDIYDIDSQLKPKSTALISFKNVLYHLLGSRGKEGLFGWINTTTVQQLFKKLNTVLTEDGLFVLGTICQDHLFDPEKTPNDFSEIVHKGKIIKVALPSPIHKLLNESGFEPVFYDKVPGIDSDILMPSVWRKVRSLV